MLSHQICKVLMTLKVNQIILMPLLPCCP